jgi:hypothetical protein
VNEKTAKELMIEALHGQTVSITNIAGKSEAAMHVDKENKSVLFELSCGVLIENVLYKRIGSITAHIQGTVEVTLDLY